MKDKPSSVIVELLHTSLTREAHILHGQEYNTGHSISSAIPDEIREEMRREPYQPESVLYPFLEGSLGWNSAILCLPHHHPSQHTEADLKRIQDMCRRNPDLGMVELWHRLTSSPT